MKLFSACVFIAPPIETNQTLVLAKEGELKAYGYLRMSLQYLYNCNRSQSKNGHYTFRRYPLRVGHDRPEYALQDWSAYGCDLCPLMGGVIGAGSSAVTPALFLNLLSGDVCDLIGCV